MRALPPTVRLSTSTLRPSARVTEVADFSKPRVPLTYTKSPRLMSKAPLARINWPWLPAMSSVAVVP